MQTDLLNLKNLGHTTVNWLRTVGIHTERELRELGAVSAYNRIRARNIKVSKVLLYALEGALSNTHWNDLAPDLKQQLLADAEAAARGDALSGTANS